MLDLVLLLALLYPSGVVSMPQLNVVFGGANITTSGRGTTTPISSTDSRDPSVVGVGVGSVVGDCWCISKRCCCGSGGFGGLADLEDFSLLGVGGVPVDAWDADIARLEERGRASFVESGQATI